LVCGCRAEGFRLAGTVYNGKVTLTEYEHQIPDRGASAVLGIWCSFPNSVTTEVDASHLFDKGPTIILLEHLA
ncbi:MAG: hypothetical protein ACLU1W_12010, partial [Collinsella sp.]